MSERKTYEDGLRAARDIALLERRAGADENQDYNAGWVEACEYIAAQIEWKIEEKGDERAGEKPTT